MPILSMLDVAEQPIVGKADFSFPGKPPPMQKSSNEHGDVEIPYFGRYLPNFAITRPLGLHWSSVLEAPRGGEKILHHPVDPSTCWWKDLIGISETDATAGHGIRIGVVDVPFRPSGSVGHVRMMTVEGKPVPEGRLLDQSHGRDVCEILASRSSDLFSQGIAPGAEIIAADIGREDEPDRWDFEKIHSAIEYLTEREGCHLINISGGAPTRLPDDLENATQLLRQAIAVAEDNGALVIAAVGRDKSENVAVPACLRNVIGVGGIGLTGVAPDSTFMQHYQRHASKRGNHRGREVFRLPTHPVGAGTYLLAPGVGMFVGNAAGSYHEVQGSSFAGPIAVGLLARTLSTDNRFWDLTGRDRREHSMKRLAQLCVTLQMSEANQGAGMPRLPSVNLNAAQ